MAQKVVSVSIPLNRSGEGYTEYEFKQLNKYLAEGYTVIDTIQNVSNSNNAYVMNITFILQE